jgi:ribosomal protein S17E
MKKKPIDNFKYVNLLVLKIKAYAKENKDYDFYFNELVTLHWPFLNAQMKKVYYKLPLETREYTVVRARLLEMFFEIILKYEPKFTDNEENKKNFTGIYFGTYLKAAMNWSIHRMSHPNKIETDDFALDKRNVELIIDVEDKKIQHPISDNFISLCRKVHKDLNNEDLSDIMMLLYGYNWKEKDICKALGIKSSELKSKVSRLNKYWRENADLILP